MFKGHNKMSLLARLTAVTMSAAFALTQFAGVGAFAEDNDPVIDNVLTEITSEQTTEGGDPQILPDEGTPGAAADKDAEYSEYGQVTVSGGSLYGAADEGVYGSSFLMPMLMAANPDEYEVETEAVLNPVYKAYVTVDFPEASSYNAGELMDKINNASKTRKQFVAQGTPGAQPYGDDGKYYVEVPFEDFPALDDSNVYLYSFSNYGYTHLTSEDNIPASETYNFLIGNGSQTDTDGNYFLTVNIQNDSINLEFSLSKSGTIIQTNDNNNEVQFQIDDDGSEYSIILSSNNKTIKSVKIVNTYDPDAVEQEAVIDEYTQEYKYIVNAADFHEVFYIDNTTSKAASYAVTVVYINEDGSEVSVKRMVYIYIKRLYYLVSIYRNVTVGDTGQSTKEWLDSCFSVEKNDMTFSASIENAQKTTDNKYIVIVKPDDDIGVANVDGAYLDRFDEVPETETNIKDELFGSGYEMDLSGEQVITLVKANDEILHLNISLYTYTTETESDDEHNPVFSVYDVLREKTEEDSDGEVKYTDENGVSYVGYGAKSVSGYKRDTYIQENYYQTIIVNDEAFDTSNVTLYAKTAKGQVIWKTTDGRTQKEMLSAEDVAVLGGQDFSDGKYHFYSITYCGQVINYAVKILKMTENDGTGKLMVVGPQDGEGVKNQTRSVKLTGRKYHDIYMRNIGDGMVYDLTAELVGAQNVKIDDFWKLDHYDLDYAKGTNEAKVRLLADGDGTVKARLKITYRETADGDIKTVWINIVGSAYASILTDEFEVGVKYVPYSQLIATNNTNKYSRTKFSVISGALPDGLELYSNGEIYGVPKTTGVFGFTVREEVSGTYASLVIEIKDNLNDLVWYESTSEPVQTIGDAAGGYYDQYEYEAGHCYLVNGDSIAGLVFKTELPYEEQFMTLWLNGEELKNGVDYNAEEGSTVITFLSHADTYVEPGRNTFSTEHRADNHLKLNSYSDYVNYISSSDSLAQNRSAQNFYFVGTEPAPTPADPEETSGGGASGSGPKLPSGTSNTASSTESETAKQEGGSMTFVFKTPEGEAVQGLNIELHSRVQKGVTDEKGSVTFNGIEDGRHSVYAYNSEGKLLAKKSFQLSDNGTALTVNGKTYNMEAFKVTITVNEDVSAGAGLNDDGTVIESNAVVTDAGKAESPISYILIMMLAAVIALGAAAKAKSSAK